MLRELGRSAGAVAGNARKPTVLIVDDLFTGRKILEELVRTIDPELNVRLCADPREALAWVREHTPDLILTDYRMPAMDGVEFTEHIRAMPACVDVPLVIVTVVEDRRIRYEALEAGATDFLTRPIDQHECRARCRNLLTLRRQQQIIKNRASWLEDQVAQATLQIRVREQETLLRLAKAGEYRDENTGGHVLRLARFSRLLAEELGLDARACDEIELAAPMHDIGKIGIPDNILLKPGKLTAQEFEVMKAHTTIGAEILKDSPSRYIQQGQVIALHHHEKFDGSGYPLGLAGQDIPVTARIVAVADVYDALGSVRPYKPAWSADAVTDYMRTQSGRHFDPQCVRAFFSRFKTIRAIHSQLRDA